MTIPVFHRKEQESYPNQKQEWVLFLWPLIKVDTSLSFFFYVSPGIALNFLRDSVQRGCWWREFNSRCSVRSDDESFFFNTVWGFISNSGGWAERESECQSLGCIDLIYMPFFSCFDCSSGQQTIILLNTWDCTRFHLPVQKQNSFSLLLFFFLVGCFFLNQQAGTKNRHREWGRGGTPQSGV